MHASPSAEPWPERREEASDARAGSLDRYREMRDLSSPQWFLCIGADRNLLLLSLSPGVFVSLRTCRRQQNRISRCWKILSNII